VQLLPKISEEASKATSHFSLWAVHPGQGRRIAEVYPSKSLALERKGQLETQGYDVLVTPADFTHTLGRFLRVKP
jgi:hypothetical protein